MFNVYRRMVSEVLPRGRHVEPIGAGPVGRRRRHRPAEPLPAERFGYAVGKLLHQLAAFLCHWMIVGVHRLLDEPHVAAFLRTERGARLYRGVRLYGLPVIGVVLLGIVILGDPTLGYSQPPAPAPSPGIYDNFLSLFQHTAGAWNGSMMGITTRLFWALVSLEFTLTTLLWAMRATPIPEMMTKLILKVMFVGFIAFMMIGLPTPGGTAAHRGIARGIPDQIIGFARSADGNYAAWTPSRIVDLGARIALGMQAATSPPPPPATATPAEQSAWYDRLGNVMSDAAGAINSLVSSIQFTMRNFVATLLIGIAAVMTRLAFNGVALTLLMVQIEKSIVMSVAVFFLAFMGFKPTAHLTDKFLGYAVYVGVKTLIIYYIVSVGLSAEQIWYGHLTDIVQQQYAALTAPYDPATANAVQAALDKSIIALREEAWSIAGAAIMFYFVAAKIPGLVAERLTNGLSFGLSEGHVR